MRDLTPNDGIDRLDRDKLGRDEAVYGAIYINDAFGGTQTVAALNTWEEVLSTGGWLLGEMRGVESGTTPNRIRVLVAGVYTATYHVTINNDIATEHHFGLGKNGNALILGSECRYGADPGGVLTASQGIIIQLEVGDELGLIVKDVGSISQFNARGTSLIVHKIM